ncbi:ABC transporter permease [Niallia endozanthoxylica]|uniref:ABC transporter permease n=1 Tax=Niallia endozanthoxylica TaxID=2036016 RepID=A0A5J5H8Q1_9BACI|nr:ABC transporter permease [Niallia endozanthoxylica]KAA9016950.1 ABC transporter permease [Niallia endozanthoxylica]
MNIIRKIAGNQLIVGFFSFIVFWEIIYLFVQTHTIPSPLETFSYFFTVIDVLGFHSLGSILRVLAALSIAILLGIPAGIFLGVNKKANRLFSPFLYYIYPIPKVAFLPVFMLLFGLGNVSKIMLIIWIVVFQMILSVRDGVMRIPVSHFKVMESYSASIKQQYRFLIIPSILPQVFSALRISIGISLASLFFAENYATTYGVGYFIMSAWTKMNYEEMFCGIIVLGFIGLLFFKLLDLLETHLTPWAAK